MHISNPGPGEHAGFRKLVNAEIRPSGSRTSAWDDFPLILDPENSAWTLVAVADDGAVVAGMAALIRDFTTNCGRISVAGLGSVVTHPDYRGQGLSRSLQDEMMARLQRHNVPLAVLWTDQPEIYAGRGFATAGWEYHVVIRELDLPGSMGLRPYEASDAAAVAALYRTHAWRTVRQDGDDARLYAMPGTRGLVATDGEGQVTAACFCGKGADFPDYVTEWSGPVEAMLPLLGAVRDRGWAHTVLVPPGGELMVDALASRGAAWFASASGQWCVLDAVRLADAARTAGIDPPSGADAVDWLGRVDGDGLPRPGALHVAVWGFDSV